MSSFKEHDIAFKIEDMARLEDVCVGIKFNVLSVNRSTGQVVMNVFFSQQDYDDYMAGIAAFDAKRKASE